MLMLEVQYKDTDIFTQDMLSEKVKRPRRSTTNKVFIRPQVKNKVVQTFE